MFLPWPTEEAISANLSMTRNVPTQKANSTFLDKNGGSQKAEEGVSATPAHTPPLRRRLVTDRIAGTLITLSLLNSCSILEPPGQDLCVEQNSPFCLFLQPQI